MSQGQPRSTQRIVVAAVVALVAVLGVQTYFLLRPARSHARPEAAQRAIQEAQASGGLRVETFGQEGAPIQVKFYAPLELEWHQLTIGMLREYDQQHPGRIHVSLMPMGLQECDEEMDYSCARILVNRENRFTLPDGERVLFEKQPNDVLSSYRSEDVITVLDELWQARE